MKRSKFKEKLVLKKSTIANLGIREMHSANGGVKYTEQEGCTNECTETDCIWTLPVWCGSAPVCTGPFCPEP